jgi:epoxyqueuosine reductase
LLNKKHGSYFFLAQMVIDLVCEPDHPVTDHCGNCTACIDACPTDALLAGKQMDASRCISYFTIELKEATPMEFHSKLNDWVFGCDICQEVCPWNRFSKPHAEEAFMPMANNLELKSSDWLDMTEEVFKNRFESSAIKRAGLKKMKENVQFALKSQSNE